jgi:hypothetical protein
LLWRLIKVATTNLGVECKTAEVRKTITPLIFVQMEQVRSLSASIQTIIMAKSHTTKLWRLEAIGELQAQRLRENIYHISL